jgi:hypothetical protein
MKGKVVMQVTVPEPCKQDWDAMPKCASGYYCKQCDTVVTDFSRMTDAQIIAFLQKERFGCGVFRNDQLKRDLIEPPVQQPLYFRRLAMGVMLFFGWIAGSDAQTRTIGKSKAQQGAVPAKQPAQISKSNKQSAGAKPVHRVDTTAAVKTADQIEKSGGVRNLNDIASLSTGVYQHNSGSGMSIGGARSASTTYVIDGVHVTEATSKQKRSFWNRIRFWKH